MELLIGLITLILLFLFWLVSPSLELKRKARFIPGIKPWPLVGNAFHYHLVGSKTISEIQESIKNFGSTFRLWLGPQLHVFITHPSDVQMLLSSQTLIEKSMIYNILDDWLGTGLLLSSGKLWQRRRKAITPTFHFKLLDDFVPLFDKCSKTLINILKERVGKGPFSINPYVSNCALDAISESAMGITIEAQLNPKSEYVSTVKEMTHSLGEKANYPWLGVEPLYSLTGRKKKEHYNLKILHSIPKQVLEEKKHVTKGVSKEKLNESDDFGIKKKKAFLELLLDMQESKSPAFDTDKDILDEVTTFMFEGHDTTASALSFSVWLLGKHEDIQENVYKEISPILDENKELKIEYLQKMVYLERVIKETLRMYPAVPTVGRTLKEDLVLPSSGITVPATSEIYVPIAVMHRNPEYFPEPNKFDPDRFLHEQKHPYVYIPFSAGPRNCIGQKFAMYELKSILARLVYNYKIKSEGDIIVHSALVLRPLNGPTVSLMPRN